MLQTSDRYTVNRDTLTIRGVITSDQDQYWCRGQIRSVWSLSNPAVYLSVKDSPRSTLTVTPDSPVFTGETVNLTCVIETHSDWRRRNGQTYDWRSDWTPEWRYEWRKGSTYSSVMLETSDRYTVNRDTLTIRGVITSDQDQYWCRGRRDKRPNSSQSVSFSLSVNERPKAVVKVSPDERVFRGETVTLTCDIQRAGDIQWTYSWFKDGSVIRDVTERLYSITSVSDRAEYSCRGERSDSQRSDTSAAVTLTVSAEAQAAVRVSPQPWLTEGDSVTLICEVTGSSTGWTFSWFRDDDRLSDSSRGAGGSYTLSPAALQHTGVYTCRAERGRPAYYTKNSSTQTLWITGQWSQVSLVVSPSRSQHFSSDSLSLSCEDQRNSAGWTVRRYTDRNTEDCSKQTGSTCRIVSLSTSDSGVYWCQSESGEKRHPLNITVHDGDVILESSVDPVIEGHTLTLHCLHRSTNSSILRADFYKDGSLVQNQTTGEMSITTVSKSHEGFYYCKTERGESLHSWISVRGSGQISVFSILSFLLAACPYLLSTVVLLFKCYRARGNTSV
uniref:Ig-like domain-containing protein n=1 Tax=Cyprinus carpio TaxID=7962 RepID=A0A8C1YR43_CYPCA